MGPTTRPTNINTHTHTYIYIYTRGIQLHRMDKIQGFSALNVDINVFTTGLHKFSKPGPCAIRRWNSTLLFEIVVSVFKQFRKN